MPNLRQLISPQIPQLGACGTSLGMTSKKDASLGMSVGTVPLARNLSRRGGIYPVPTEMPIKARTGKGGTEPPFLNSRRNTAERRRRDIFRAWG